MGVYLGILEGWKEVGAVLREIVARILAWRGGLSAINSRG